MSTNRKTSWDKFPKKQVDGKWVCRWCSKECLGRRTSFCSDNCFEEVLKRTDPRYMRKLVFERDKGVCSVCGMDTVKKRKELREIKKNYGTQFYLDVRKSMKIPKHRTSLWDADHILAVVDGFGECGIENMATLCIFCHRKKTSALQKRLAMERKTKRVIILPASFDSGYI